MKSMKDVSLLIFVITAVTKVALEELECDDDVDSFQPILPNDKEKVSILDVPFFVHVEIHDETGWEYRSAGAIIQEKWVIASSDAIFKVHVGLIPIEHIHIISRADEALNGGRVHLVANFYSMDYNGYNTLDVAGFVLLKTKKKFEFDKYCQPISLYHDDPSLRWKKVAIFGHGDIETGEASKEILKTTTSYMNPDICNPIINVIYPGIYCLPDWRMCFLICRQDVGSPIVVYDNVVAPNGTLIGVVTGNQSASCDSCIPGVHINISVDRMYDWIKEIIAIKN